MPRFLQKPALQRSPNEERLLAQFTQMTEVDLPARARDESWPIRFDHCFKRICLDHAFSDVWYGHLSRPAERHIAGAALERAHYCAKDLLAQGQPLLAERNLESLAYRRKTGPGRSCPAAAPVPPAAASEAHPARRSEPSSATSEHL